MEYKVKESKELDKTAAELTADRSNVQAELDAVLEYLSKIEDECVAKPESYEQRKALVSRACLEVRLGWLAHGEQPRRSGQKMGCRQPMG